MADRGQVMGPPDGMITMIIIAAVVGLVGVNVMDGTIDLGAIPWRLIGYALLAIFAALIARGLWILYMSSEARLEQTKAEVKAREGRNPEDAMTYHQDIEARALAYIKRIPLIGRAFRYF